MYYFSETLKPKNMIMKKITNSPYIVFLLLLKEAYETVLIVISFFKNTTETMETLFNFSLFSFDTLIKIVIVIILYVVLRKLQEQKNYYDIQKVLHRVVNIQRAEHIYLAGKGFSKQSDKTNYFRENLSQEYDYCKKRLLETYPDLSPNEVNFILDDFYGYTREKLNEREQ